MACTFSCISCPVELSSPPVRSHLISTKHPKLPTLNFLRRTNPCHEIVKSIRSLLVNPGRQQSPSSSPVIIRRFVQLIARSCTTMPGRQRLWRLDSVDEFPPSEDVIFTFHVQFPGRNKSCIILLCGWSLSVTGEILPSSVICTLYSSRTPENLTPCCIFETSPKKSLKSGKSDIIRTIVATSSMPSESS